MEEVRTLHDFTMKSIGAYGNNRLYGTRKLECACMYSGAEQSVIGVQQATDYTNITVKKMHPVESTLIFRFGDGKKMSEGFIEVRIRLPTSEHVAVNIYVVQAYIHRLIGMEVL